MIELAENLEELISSSSTLILQFGEETCGPCHAIRFRLDRWLNEHETVTARYVDIGQHLQMCSQMGIMSAPAVIVFMDGKIVAKEAGYFSLDDLLWRTERVLQVRDEISDGRLARR